ncbi:MAG: response regulator [Treponema sp.]|nr:response regulator [Candidatus Treponema equi]
MKSVLLIDGSPLFQDFLRDKVAAEQITIECASARESYSKMISLLPDLIIIEIEKNLTEELKILLEKKSTDPNAKRIPIIMTGPVMDRTKVANLVEYGVVKYFTKPIKFDIFFESIGRILKTPLSMDTTPCILDIHLNGNIIFVELAQGLNREKLMLLKYKLAEIINRYKINVPKVILMLTNLELTFVDGANLELLLNNITCSGRIANNHVKILSLDDFVTQLVKGHMEYRGMVVSQNLQYVMSSLMNEDPGRGSDSKEFLYDNILHSDRPTDDVALGFIDDRSTGDSNTGTMMRVALVDDDVVIRKLLENTFTSASAETSLFENATSFMSAIGSGQVFDIVILDLYLPDMDGISILKTLMQRNYQTPILIYSKASSKEVVLNALSLGAKSYLVKPQKPEVILHKALEILHSVR